MGYRGTSERGRGGVSSDEERAGRGEHYGLGGGL